MNWRDAFRLASRPRVAWHETSQLTDLLLPAFFHVRALTALAVLLMYDLKVKEWEVRANPGRARAEARPARGVPTVSNELRVRETLCQAARVSATCHAAAPVPDRQVRTPHGCYG